ncbi:MAG: hypothetical protein WD716_03960 [Fimbriimonadaceae bacterium]
MEFLTKTVEKIGDLLVLWVKMLFDIDRVTRADIESAYAGNIVIQIVAGVVVVSAALAQEPGTPSVLVTSSNLAVVLFLALLLAVFVKVGLALGQSRPSSRVDSDIIIKSAFVAFSPGLCVIGGAMAMMLNLTDRPGETKGEDVTSYMLLVAAGLWLVCALPAYVIQRVTDCCTRRVARSFAAALLLLGVLLVLTRGFWVDVGGWP